MKCSKEVQKLHDFRIIHGDLKPANFMADIKGNQIEINVIDFGFSLLLEPGKEIIISDSKGSVFYMAPEIEPIMEGDRESEITLSNDQKVAFSFASDIYALGKMFKDDLQLSQEIYDGMLLASPKNRDNILVVINKLYAKLINGLLDKYNTYDKIKQYYDSYASGSAKHLFFSLKEKTHHTIMGTNHLDILKNITKQIDELQKNNSMPLNDKANYALSYITSILSHLKNEEKIFEFESSLEKWCNHFISEITGVIGDEKILTWDISWQQSAIPKAVKTQM